MSLPKLTIVIPVYNEENNIRPLFEAVIDGVRDYAGEWDVIIVNDGSQDDTAINIDACLKNVNATYQFQGIELQRNFGQTAAMQAGIDAATGELIATMDGDLQNDPADIPRMVKELLKRDLDLLQGWRKDRKDPLFSRKIPSRLANKLIRRMSGVKLNDYGCSLKIYRADILKQIRLYGEMHRFIPVWMATVSPPHRMGQTFVNHRPRVAGTSSYGISRSIRVTLDLLSVIFFLKYRGRPGHFFGSIGLCLWLSGCAALSYLGILKYFYGEAIGLRPMLLIASLLIIASLQFFTAGIISEVLSRIFFQTTNVHSYQIRKPPPHRYLDDIHDQ